MNYKNPIYLDNAASSFPKPQCVINKMHKIMVQNTANPGRSGHFLSNENAKIIYETRKIAAEFFGVGESPEKVIFTHSATHAINIAINGLVEEGDTVIISDMEHNSVLRPLAERAKSGKIQLKIAEVADNDDETANNFKKLIDKKTKMVFTTHASNVNGKVLPVKKIGKICKEYNIIFCIDASQTAGHLKIDVKDIGADILCTAGHKGLFGPQGTGLLIINGDIALKPLIFGGTGGASLLEIQPDEIPESLESGTQNTSGIAGLGEGIKFISKYGNKLNKTGKHLYEKAFEAISKINGVQIYSSQHNPTHILAFNIRDLPSELITDRLNSKGICVRGGFHCSALFHKKMKTTEKGIVRASIGGFNTEMQIGSFIRACKEL